MDTLPLALSITLIVEAADDDKISHFQHNYLRSPVTKRTV
jgi:hypothetical protein